MHVRFGLHSGHIGNQGTCVSSVFNPHTGLQQCPTCINLGDVGMQCPASHPVCCIDQRCVQNATQCNCNGNDDCLQGTCCNGNRRASEVPSDPDSNRRYSCICPVITCMALSGAEWMQSMPLDHDCFIITEHMHCCGEVGALVTDLETGTPSMRMLVYARAVWIAFRCQRAPGHVCVQRI
jgi:hypothetical protein